MTQKRKICFVAPSLQMGGIERAMSSMANYIVSNYEIDVCYLTIFPFDHFFALDAKITLFEPPYHFSRTGRSNWETLKYYNAVLSPFNGYIKRKIFELKPDVIVCYGDWFPHLIMLAVGNKIPLYYSNRSNPNIKYGLHIEFIRKLAYWLTPPAGIIAQTSAAANRKKRLLGNKSKIQIIPNPAREVRMYDVEKQNYIISVGRLHLEKGFVRLMEVFATLRAENWKLVLVGGGIHENEIKNKAKDLGISDRIIFAGKSNEVDKWLSQSKIFVLSSHNEGFPNALCEGMAAGLACVSFDIVAGPADIIKNGINGFLVPDNDLAEMRVVLQNLIDNEKLRIEIGSEAKKIVQTYSFSAISQKFVEFVLNN